MIVFAGASQFAAAGMVAAGFAWPAIVVLTALVNARHLLYSAAMAPWLRGQSFVKRIVMAHLLTDEAFALSSVHFRRLGRVDPAGYWIAAIGSTFIPWNLATILGVLGGQFIPDPEVLGLDVDLPGGDGRPGRRPVERPAGGGRGGGRGDLRRRHRPALGQPGRGSSSAAWSDRFVGLAIPARSRAPAEQSVADVDRGASRTGLPS